MRLISVADIARLFGVKGGTVRAWRRRYPDFPSPVVTDPYPRYRLGDIEGWYALRWPGKSDKAYLRIHRFQVVPTERGHGVKMTTTKMGNLDYTTGYLAGVRDAAFSDWRVYYVKGEGFSAHKDNEVEVWVVDPTSHPPDPWYVYDARFKTGGRFK